MLENKQFHEDEIWKEIQGFEGLYAVSNRGRVKNIKTNRVFTGGYDGNGYNYVKLKDKNYHIHRLVGLAFLDNPKKLPYINHIDEDKTNNNVGNLAWCTASENTRHSTHKYSCQVKQLTKDGNLIKIWPSIMQIERELGYFRNSIRNACTGKQRYAYGFQWQYLDTSQQRKQNRPVAALTKDGEFVAEYKSAAEASRCLKIKGNCVYLCLKGTCKSTHGLRFIYIDD